MNTTLITGASSGIGEAFARRLAAEGHNLLLVARREDRLAKLCAELGPTHKINAQYLAMDLSKPEAPFQVFTEAQRRGLVVEMLINNAGFGSVGDFAALDLDNELKMIDLNIRALTAMTHLFLGPMLERQSGTIVNVASTAAFQPVPFFANYSATKAYVLSLSEALWEENRLHGIQVMALCPGVTKTEFFEAGNITKFPARTVQSSEQVIEVAMRALRRRRSYVVSGLPNRLVIRLQRLLPRSIVLRVVGKVMRPKYGRAGLGVRG